MQSGSDEQETFVLVHGAWHGGWCYARVAKVLRRRGHLVFTPTLTGLGDRSHLRSMGLINCSTHVQDIVNVLKWEQLTNVVLCGHSYGGAVISGVADAMPERIASLVYLDAIVPANQSACIDLVGCEELVELLRIVADHAGCFAPPAPAAQFNVNVTDRETVDCLCTPQPLATFTERLKLSDAYEKIAKKTFVMAMDWAGTPALRETYHRLRQDPFWRVVSVASGHDVMLDVPEDLAEILLDAI